MIISAGPRASCLLVVILGLLVALPNIKSLPLDAHEVLVVRSAEEMHARGDWVVPYFNDAPRLNKPPLNYWLTAGTAWLTSSLDNIQPWHGRVPSLFAGIGLISLTLLLGSLLFDRPTAIAAALILVSSAGYFSFSHDARPDLLYALWCTAGYTAFVIAEKHRSMTAGMLGCYAMWIAYALAALTKGPHLPVFLLFATAGHLFVRSRDLKTIRATMRPISGLLVFLAITLPWVWLLRERLPATMLADSQLSGSLLQPDWQAVFTLYYFYRPLELILPWLALLPVTFYSVYRRYREADTSLLIALIVVPVVLLSFASQHRPFYLLPVVVPMCLLLAKSTIDLARGEQTLMLKLYQRFMLPLHLCIIAITVYWATYGHWDATTLSLTIVAIVGSSLAWCWRRPGLIRDLQITALALAMTFSALAMSGRAWSTNRYETHRLAETVNQHLSDQQGLAAWQVNPVVFVYYADRSIPWLKGYNEIAEQITSSPTQSVLLLAPLKQLDELTKRFSIRVVDSTMEPEADATALVVASER